MRPAASASSTGGAERPVALAVDLAHSAKAPCGDDLREALGRDEVVVDRRPARPRAAAAWWQRRRRPRPGGRAQEAVRRAWSSRRRTARRGRAAARARRPSLDILDLLPHPLDLGLEPRPRAAAISALCDFEPMVFTSRCISWTRKSSLRPAGSPPPKQRPHLRQVAAQPRQLLGDIGAIGEQRDLLREPRRVERDAARELRDPLREPRAVVLRSLRDELRDARDGAPRSASRRAERSRASASPSRARIPRARRAPPRAPRGAPPAPPPGRRPLVEPDDAVGGEHVGERTAPASPSARWSSAKARA